jgi:hypothetical protein
MDFFGSLSPLHNTLRTGRRFFNLLGGCTTHWGNTSQEAAIFGTSEMFLAIAALGAVLGGAYVTERLMPGVAYMDHGTRCDWIIPGELDRGGAINLISPEGVLSKNCAGQATSGYLVDVQKVTERDWEEWRKKDPVAFDAALKREYDPASGLRFNAWIIEGGK